MPNEEPRYPPIPYHRYRQLKWAFGALFGLLCRITVEGAENVPKDGPIILYLNHLHLADPPAMLIASPRHLHHLAAEKWEHHPIFSRILAVGGAIYIQRGEVDRDALKKALAVLEDGHCLALAIEGTRTKTGGLQAAKSGVAYFATRANVPLLPVALWGTERILPELKRLRRADLHVRFGEPFRLPEGRARSADLDRYAETAMVRLAALLPEEYRGVYRDHPELVSVGEASPA